MGSASKKPAIGNNILITVEYATGYVVPKWDDRMRIMIIVSSCGTLLGQSLTKTAFAVTLLKLTRGFSHRKACHAVLWFCIVSMLSYNLAKIVVEWGKVSGKDVYDVWYRLDFYLDSSVRKKFKEVGNYYNILMDFVFALFPWILTWNMDMKRKEKIGLCLTMSLGMVVAIQSTIRNEWKYSGNDKDRLYFWRLAMSNIWYNSEITGTIIVQCVPVLRPLVQDLYGARRERVKWGTFLHAPPSIPQYHNTTITYAAAKMNMSTMSRGRPSTTQATQGRSTAGPEYEPPKFPLNPAAQRALAQLSRSANLTKLSKSLAEAQTQLTDTAVQMNDRVTNATASAKRSREKRQREHEGQDEEQTALERNLAQFQAKVDGMTQRMEESMRKLVDHQHGVEAIKQSLAKAEQHAHNTASTQASTQNARTQRRTRRTNGEDGEDDGEAEEEASAGEEEYPDFTPTDPAGGTPGQRAPVEVFRTNLKDAKLRYEAMSQAERYSEVEAYYNFREVVHDAVHQDKEDVPPQDKSKWFSEGGVAAPGITNRNVDAENGEEDDDLAISKATISTKCLLTLREFVYPYTSKKCPHSFEKDAILGMIDASARRTVPGPGQRHGEKCVICPVGGCQEQLTKNDLGVDKVIVRKIERLQRSRELQEQEEDDDSDTGHGATQNRALSIDDDAEDDDTKDAAAVRPKPEPHPTGASSRAPPSTAPRPTQVIDLSDEEDDEEGDVEDSMVE
ncbi:uncharacterized protein RCC_01507 [Ramularia collo-cygni]|uniref:SP-RING-type domain-containing protein n=1 Tax=Ramularia collo-cygni TaxID=112498 RepID=A0A2D3V5U7_9PEZI|nr:uncharacterized protein RCC_01507 [Ramularia collo-cygni]CZT15673.1 uncharacterized protein RCC_01507 [Ramularia collo-cygni]